MESSPANAPSRSSSDPSTHPSPQWALSPVPAVAAHLLAARDAGGSIVFPQSLLQPSAIFLKQIPRPVISASETTALVEALDNGTPDICSRLNDMAFQTVYAFLKISEPCLAHQRGHCLFVVQNLLRFTAIRADANQESLHSSRATTRAQKASLTARKSALGRNVLPRLIQAFLDSPQSSRARRGIGSLALELLRDCPENKYLISTEELALTRRALGQAVIEGNDDILRLIASTIIRELVDNGRAASEFLPLGDYPDPACFFQDKKEYTAQWTTEFVEYVDELKDNGVVAEDTESGLSILVTITDDGLTIVIPSTDADTAKYIDVPLEHISRIRLTEGCPGSQPQRLTATRPAVLALNAYGGSKMAYYINETGRASCEVVLAFDRLHDAESIKAQIESTVAQREDSEGPNGERGTTQADPDPLKYHVVQLSQGGFVDVSISRPGQEANQEGTASQYEPVALDATRPSHVNSAVSEAHRVTPAPTQRRFEGRGSQRERSGDSGTNKALATGISVATTVVDVGPELTDADVHDHGRSNSEDVSIVEPSNSTTWRHGLEIIETAQEFKAGPATVDPSAHAGTLQTIPEDHDDLYSATPRRLMMQPTQQTGTNAHQDSGGLSVQTMTSADVTRGSSEHLRKLSKSMRQAGSERYAAHPSTAIEISTQRAKPSLSKSKTSIASRPSTSKRKDTPVTETAVTSKKQKVKDVTLNQSSKCKKAPDHSYAPATNAEYDIPATPVGPKLRAVRLGKGQSKATKNSRSANEGQPAQKKSKDKAAKAKPSVPKRSPRVKRPAAQKAMRRLRGIDTRSEAEGYNPSNDTTTADVNVMKEGTQQVTTLDESERSSNNLSRVNEAVDRANMPQQPAIAADPVPQPPAAVPTNAVEEDRMFEPSRMPANQIQEDVACRSRLPRLPTPEPTHVVVAQVREQRLQNRKADKYTKSLSGGRTAPSSKKVPQPLLQLSEALQNDSDPSPVQQPMAPTWAPFANIAPSIIHDNKKRPRNGVDEHHSSHKKMKRTPRADRGQCMNGFSTEVQKDPSRRPQIIGFSASGPRNQGIPSPGVDSKDQGQYRQPRRRTPGPNQIQKAKGDVESIVAETLNVSIPDSAHVDKHRGAEEVGLEDIAEASTLPSDPLLQPEQSVLIEEPLQNRGRDTLLQLRSLSYEDHVPRISSLGSRVNANGSPLPSQRTGLPRGKVHYMDDESDSEDGGLQLGDDETTLVQEEYENPPEIGLPPISVTLAGRTKRVGFVGSSNSKHGPSSPSAPSGMLSAVQPHTVEADGDFVHVHTDAVLVPSRPPDPFASQDIQRPNRFADKLRRVSQTAHQRAEGSTVGYPSSPRSRKDAASMTEQHLEQVPDAAHVEPIPSRSRRRNQMASIATDTSSSSSSEAQSRSPSVSDAHDERWRNALEPYHQNTLAVLYEISHVRPSRPLLVGSFAEFGLQNLIGHLIDAETAIYDVVKDYQRRGERVVTSFAEDLERELEQYSRTAQARRDEVKRKNKEWLAKIAKNLQRQPKAGGLREQLDERQKVLDAQMELAIGLCAD
ncbi:MAG: hypothetical protein Q9173_002528 [Seirophora scorigena]